MRCLHLKHSLAIRKSEHRRKEEDWVGETEVNLENNTDSAGSQRKTLPVHRGVNGSPKEGWRHWKITVDFQIEVESNYTMLYDI